MDSTSPQNSGASVCGEKSLAITLCLQIEQRRGFAAECQQLSVGALLYDAPCFQRDEKVLWPLPDVSDDLTVSGVSSFRFEFTTACWLRCSRGVVVDHFKSEAGLLQSITG